MAIRQQFFLNEDASGQGVATNVAEYGGDDGKTLQRAFPVDNYAFPEEIKRQATEWHVLKVPLLGQRVGKEKEEPADWCGRTSACMVYNWFQLIKGGDPRERYITHSRAGDPACKLDLRYPGGERAFWHPADDALPKRGWTAYPQDGISYEIQSNTPNPDGEIPLPFSQIFPAPPTVRPKGVGLILRYHAPESFNDAKGQLLPDGMRPKLDEIRKSETEVRKRFAHLIDCLRANNPVVIYTGVGLRNERDNINPRHIICISGYCILKIAGEDQLWLVTADPSSKRGLVTNKVFLAPNERGLVDLGSPIGPAHTLVRMRSGINPNLHELNGFASFNLVRAKALFDKNPQTHGTDLNLILDHRDTRGGRYLYREKRTEVPPEAVDSSFSRPRYVFPLRGSTAATSPWQGYWNNESLDTGIGGYYVLGLQRNLHGGVHLFPPEEQKNAPVRAVAPGYVVAARLPGDTASCREPGVLEALGNWPGFVLVRHELEDLSTAAQSTTGPKKGHAFYTLYMHLRSPVFPGTSTPAQGQAAAAAPPEDVVSLDKYYREVPWFRELYKRRFGAWVNIADTSGSHPLGALLWSDEEVKAGESKTKRKVLGANGALVDITVRTAAGEELWIHKAPPANLGKAMEALAAGKVVTFPEPFFPVATGDAVGFVGPLPAGAGGDTRRVQVKLDHRKAAEKRKKFELRSGFLHFQVFSPERDAENGIKLLTRLAEQLELPEELKKAGGKPPKFVEVKESAEDNFLDVNEIQTHLKNTLPSEDQAAFTNATNDEFTAAKDRGGFGYAQAVASLLDSETSFAPKAGEPDWKACTHFAYPLKLEVAVGYLPPPDKNNLLDGGNYELELHFDQELAGGEWRRMDCPSGECGELLAGRMVCKPGKLELTKAKLSGAKNGVVQLSLMVPALADRMSLKAKKGFFVDQSVPLKGADSYLLAQGLTRRWRNVRLVQKSEWVPENVKGVVSKANEALKPSGLRISEAEAVQIAWCDPAKEEHIPRVLANGTDQSAKLFDDAGWLPPSSRLENLHPVSAVWLLNVLDKQNKARVRSEWPVPRFRKEDPSPLLSGWVKLAGERRLGDAAIAVVIDEDFGYGQDNAIALRIKQGSSTLELTRGAAAGSGGNIVQSIQTSFWGEWTLEVTDTAATPKVLTPRKQHPRLVAALSIPRPKLAGPKEGALVVAEQPKRLPDGSWRWRLDFEGAVPRELPAFVLLRTSKTADGAGAAYADAVLPVTARPVQVAAVPPVASANFEVLDDAIVGLTPAGKKVWEAPKQKLYVVDGLVGFRECFEAMDIKVGWALVKELTQLTAKKLSFELVSIGPDGLSCTLRGAKPQKLYEAATTPDKNLVEGGLLELTFEPAECGDPKLQALWVFDEARETVLNCKPAGADTRLGPFPFRKYRTVYLSAPKSMRVSLSLASALGQVASVLDKKLPALERIESDGLACILNTGGKAAADKVRAAAGLGAFNADVADPAQPAVLRITPNLAARQSLFVSFHPGKLFSSLAAGDLEPGVELFHWFELAALNGQGLLYPFGGETTAEGDGSITLAKFDELKAKTSEHLRVTHKEPGRYRKVALRNMAPKEEGATGEVPPKRLSFKPLPKLGQCELEISARVSGAPEDLKKYQAVFSRKAPNGTKWEPIQGFNKVLPDKLEIRDQNAVADWLIAARVPYPQPVNDKKNPLDGKNGFKLELVALSPETVPQKLEQEGEFDFTPRWEGPLKVQQKGELLELRCHAEGIEVPLPGSKDKAAWNVARELELVIDTDPAPEKGAMAKLMEHVRYATPTQDGRRGGCDPTGDFVATMELKAFTPGVAYRFTVRRPLDQKTKKPRPVRLTALAPLTRGEPFKVSANPAGEEPTDAGQPDGEE